MKSAKPGFVTCFVMMTLFVAGCATGPSPNGSDLTGADVYVAAHPAAVGQVAVLPFKASTELIGSSFSDIFGTRLLKTGRYTLVERSQITGVLGETELAMSGMSDSAAIAAGRMIGAEGVVLGTVDEYATIAYKGRTYPVVGASVRLIDCETGQVLWSVGYSSRSTDRMDTLSGHARKVADRMIAALRSRWHVQRRTGQRASASRAAGPSSASGSGVAPAFAARPSSRPQPAKPAPPPTAPDYAVSDMGLREVTLQWPPPPGNYRIRVERSALASGPFVAIAAVDGDRGQYTDRGDSRNPLEDGKTYYYRLVTLNDAGQESRPTAVKESMTAPPPDPPRELVAKAPAARAVALSWPASTSPGVVIYRVERKGPEDPDFVQVGEVRQSEFREGGDADSPLKDLTVYRYRVRAGNRVGALGRASDPIEITTRPPPAAVTGLSARSDRLRCIPLKWEPAAEDDVDRYRVYRRQPGAEAWQLLAEVRGRPNNVYLDGGHNPGTLDDAAAYAYRVAAVNAVGAEGEAGDTVTARTRERPPRVLGFEAESGLPRKVALRWAISDDELVSGYHVWRSKDGGDFERIARVEGREIDTYIDEGDEERSLFGGSARVPLADGTAYRYRMTAFNPAGAESETPSETQARTKAIPPTPAAPAAHSGLAGRVALEWARPAGDDIGGYAIMAGDSENGGTDIGRTSEPRFEESGLQPGQTRWYAVRVVDKDGLESLPSPAVAATTKPLPDAPSGLSTERRAGGWLLSWEAPPQNDIAEYRLCEKRFLGKSELTIVKSNRIELSDADVGKKKVVMVQAIDADGLESALSEPIEIRAAE